MRPRECDIKFLSYLNLKWSRDCFGHPLYTRLVQGNLGKHMDHQLIQIA